eukprot:GHVL01032109.1.p1 GENE.GHVL01032109.1~~GHVL01032109.1.p1  ORF type:complete len:167 (-),score=4.29 GHVL01032109.1:55-555(-)
MAALGEIEGHCFAVFRDIIARSNRSLVEIAVKYLPIGLFLGPVSKHVVKGLNEEAKLLAIIFAGEPEKSISLGSLLHDVKECFESGAVDCQRLFEVGFRQHVTHAYRDLLWLFEQIARDTVLKLLCVRTCLTALSVILRGHSQHQSEEYQEASHFLPSSFFRLKAD